MTLYFFQFFFYNFYFENLNLITCLTFFSATSTGGISVEPRPPGREGCLTCPALPDPAAGYFPAAGSFLLQLRSSIHNSDYVCITPALVFASLYLPAFSSINWFCLSAITLVKPTIFPVLLVGLINWFCLHHLLPCPSGRPLYPLRHYPPRLRRRPLHFHQRLRVPRPRHLCRLIQRFSTGLPSARHITERQSTQERSESLCI